jgi:hypothetical protein
MNLEQIVKETVAKIVAEKTLTAAEEKKREEIVKAMKKDFKGPAPAMYAIATDKAKKLAEESDHEVSMAQRSLDSIIRAAMELKAKIGNQEIDIPAWIQDHITNSENYIDQASQGYHEYSNGGEEMDEAFQPKTSFDDYSIGDTAMIGNKKVKITAMKMDDESGERRARVRFEDGSVKDININSLDETRDPNSESNTPYYAVFDVHNQPYYIIAKSASEMLSRLNGYIRAKAETNPEYKFSYDMEDLQDDYYNGKLMPHVISDDFASVTKNAEEFKQDLSYYPNAIEYKGLSEDDAALQAIANDTSKMPAERDAARNKIYASRAKKESQELDEWTIRRMQHYAGIK